MSDAYASAHNIFHNALKCAGVALKMLARLSTPAYDINQGGSQAFVDALKAYETGADPKKLAQDELEHYNVFLHLRATLDFTNATLEEAKATLPENLGKMLDSQLASVNAEALPFEEPASTLVRILWATANGSFILWDSIVAGLGPELTHAPRANLSNFRSVCLFTHYLMSPTTNNRQLFDMSVQRTIQIIPGTVAYTIGTAEPTVYGTALYNAASITTSMALLAAIVLPAEISAYRDKNTLKKYLKYRSQPTPHQMEANPQLDELFDKFKISADELKEIKNLIQSTATRTMPGHATNAQTTSLRTALQTYLDSIAVITTGELPTSPEDPDRKKKVGVLGMGATLAGSTLAASAETPMNLLSYLQWAVFYLYRLRKSAFNGEATVSNTVELFTNAGAIMLVVTPAFLFPLFTDKDFFTKHPQIFKSFTFGLCFYCVFLIHRVAPGALKGLELMRKHGDTPTISQDSQPGEVTDEEFLAIFRSESEELIELFLAGTASPEPIDMMFKRLLSKLDLLEKKMRRTTAKSTFPDDHKAEANPLDEPASLIDFFSFLDIREDTKELGRGERT